MAASERARRKQIRLPAPDALTHSSIPSSFNFNFSTLLWLGFRHRHRQDPIAVLGIDVFRVDVRGQWNRAVKLLLMPLPAALLRFLFALTSAKHQLVVFDLQVKIVWLESRRFGSDDDLVFFIFDIQTPARFAFVGPCRQAAPTAEKLVVQTVEFVSQTS